MGDLLVHPTQWGSNGYSLAPWLASLEALDHLDVSAVYREARDGMQSRR